MYRLSIRPILLFIPFLVVLIRVSGQPINDLNAFHKHGQTWLTWENISDPNVFYKVYRSTFPVADSSQISLCEFLGWTNSESAIDHDLTAHDGTLTYLVIDSGSSPLPVGSGLFVATTLEDGNYYYTVTTVINDSEDRIMVPGSNSLLNPTLEMVREPLPVLQQIRFEESLPIEIYSIFTSMKYATGQPLMNEAGFMANDIAFFRNDATGRQALHVRFHGGGTDFLNNIIAVSDSEVNLNPEDYFPNRDYSGWFGTNEQYNIYEPTNLQGVPVSGINYNYSQQRLTHILHWAIKYLPVDSNRIYFEGTSLGTIGAYFYAMTFPDQIAAVKLTASCFNFAFQNDYNPYCTLNAGNSNRVKNNKKFGTVMDNLPTNTGINTFDLFNGGWLCHTFNDKNYPLIYSINGKYDTILGWTEKTIYYDSINANHLGGYYLWDGRNHGTLNATWADDNFDLFRYCRNLSYPAFAHCSTNEDYGDGHAGDGASFGSINGFLEWDPNVYEDTANWKATIFMKNLREVDSIEYIAPETCTVDVTPRRKQHFFPVTGDSLAWYNWHHGQLIQSGSMIYDSGIIVIPQVMVYKDTIELELVNESIINSTNSFFGERNISLSIFPNPFWLSTIIQFKLPKAEECVVEILDLKGVTVKRMAMHNLEAGIHNVNWDGTDNRGNRLNAGVYIVRLLSQSASITEKALVTR